MARLIVLILLSSCISRRDIDAVLWSHDRVPSSVCAREPKLEDLGIARKVNCTEELVEIGICRPGQITKTEFISVCQPEIKNYLSIEKKELEALLKKAGVKE
jgi:hypothetical protein